MRCPKRSLANQHQHYLCFSRFVQMVVSPFHPIVSIFQNFVLILNIIWLSLCLLVQSILGSVGITRLLYVLVKQPFYRFLQKTYIFHPIALGFYYMH